MNLATFISTYTGQAVDVDGVSADTGQCVQLVALYCQKVLGYTLPDVTGAVNLWTNAAVLQNFNQIPVGQEQPGDITVWGASTLIDSPVYGHTDIVISHGFNGFDSNWGDDNNAAGYPVAHQVEHTYTDVLGFLRFKEANVNNTPNLNQGDLVNIWGVFENAQPTAEDSTNWLTDQGGNWKTLTYDVLMPLMAQAQQEIATLKAQQTQPTVVVNGVNYVPQ